MWFPYLLKCQNILKCSTNAQKQKRRSPIIFASAQSSTDIAIPESGEYTETYYFNHSAKTFERQLQTVQAATPLASIVTFTRSADCNTYQVGWAYSFPSGSVDKTDMDWSRCCNLDPDLWVPVLNQGTGKSSYTVPATSWTTLKTYGYYLGQGLRFRLRFSNNAFLASEYLDITSSSTLFMQTPGNTTVAPQMMQLNNGAGFIVSWPDQPTSWDSSASPVGSGNGAISYTLERYYSGNSWQVLATTTTSYYQTSVSALGWTWNTVAYYFRVSTKNSCGTSPVSAEMNYKFIDTTPTFMNPPILEWSFDSVIKVRWNGITDQAQIGFNDILSYQLQYSTSSGFATSQILSDSLTYSYTQTSYTAATGGWTLGAIYYYRLVARNVRGYGVASTTLTVQTPGLPGQMDPPTLFSRTGYAIVLKWLPLTTSVQTALTTITHYSLRTRLSTQTDADWVYLTSPNYLSLSYEHFSFTRGTSTYYQVRAHNVFGGSLYWSTTLIVQTPQTPQKMATPSNDLINPAAIRINWVDFANEGFKGYETITAFSVERSTNPSTGFSLVAQVSGSIFTFTDVMTPAFPAGVTYYYRTNAYNLLGWGATPSDSCVVLSDDYPGASVNLQSGAIEPNSIFLTWTPLSVLDAGRDSVTFYAVELYNSTTTMWEQKNTDYANLYIAYSYTSATVFPASTTYQFRIRPKNGVGYSLSTSNTVTVLTDGYPISMTSLTPGTITPTSMKMSWTALTDMVQNAGDLPIYYKVEWENRETNPLNPTWDEVTKFSDGLKLELVYIRPTGTGVFPSGSIQRFRAVAKNNVGFGTAYSPILEMQADEVPISMTTPTINAITPNSVSLSWGEITLPAETGRDDVQFYHVKWQMPTLDWSYVTNYPTSTTKLTSITHTLPSGVFNSGANQNYQVCAMNGVGTGACGAVTAKADEVPIRMNDPTEVEINPNNIKIQWNPITLETDTGRDAVIFYHVDWEKSPGVWKRLTTYPTSKTIITNLRHTLNALDPFLIFPSRSTQNYKVCAQNGVGEGACGGIAITADGTPTMALPPNIQNNDIDPDRIKISWSQINTIYDGDDPVVYYQLEWDQGIDSWVVLTDYIVDGPIQTSFNHQPGGNFIFASGATIHYRVTAQNGVGLGNPSTHTAVVCDEVPTFMNPPVNDSVGYKQINISWSAISQTYNGRDSVTYWSLEWFKRDCYTDDLIVCTNNFDPADGAWQELTLYSQNSGNGGARVRLSTWYNHTIATHFYPNTDFAYRLRAKNDVGYGVYSAVTLVLTDDVPMPMKASTMLMVRSNYVILQWDKVTDFQETGRDTLKSYTVLWDQGTGVYVSLTTINVSPVVLNYKHQVSGLLPLDHYINYKITCTNGVGTSSVDLASALQVKTPSKPTFMNAPFNVSVKAMEINLQWTPLDNSTQWEEQGRETITYYTIEYDPNVGYFSALNPAPGSLVTTFKLNSGANPFPANVYYKFRVMASNVMGNGAYSSELVLVTDNVPSQVQNLAEISIAPKIIEVQWDALTDYEDTGRDPMTYYKLQYHDNTLTGSWSELTSTSNAAVTYFKHQVSTPFPANIDMSDHFVKYRVYGRNMVGTGVASAERFVLTRTYPLVMPKVTIDDPQPNSIVISWLPHPADDAYTGRDPIIHYKVMWNQITTPLTENWVEISTFPNLASTLTVTSGYLINTNYRVKIAAQNGVGVGIYSDTETVLTDNVPTFMNAPTEDSSTNANYIKVNWVPITTVDYTGRDDVIYYKLEWDQSTGVWVNANIPTNQLKTSWSFSSSINNGSTYSFRVTPKNGVGYGATSAVMTLIPSSAPQVMNRIQVTLQQSSTQVKFAWDYPIDNGDAVNEYLIEFKDSTGAFIPYLTTCDGADPIIVSRRYCYIEMTTLWDAPFSLAKGAKIVARGKAKNIKGFCATTSNEDPAQFSLVVEQTPNAPSTPSEGSSTTWNVLHVTWSQINDYSIASGGVTAAIKSYNLERNLGNNSDVNVPDTWISINGLSPLSLALQHFTSTDIVGGTTYKLRVQALNKYGWGAWSNIKEIRCANPPADPAWINTSNSSTNVYITWNLPFNMGLQVENFTIQILKKGGDPTKNSAWAEPSECDGSDFTINSTQSCLVPMATLRGAPYVYGLDDKIRVRVRATNLEGSGNYFSITTVTPGNNVKIQTPPSAPTVAILNYPLVTNDLQIKISWTAHNTIALQGGIEVTAYEVWWTDSVFDYELLYTDTFPFQLNYLYTKLDPLDVSNPAHEIIPGTQYKFKYRAINIHGPSLFSGELPIIASFRPDKLAAPTTSLYNITLTVAWTATPNDHSRPVTKYSIKFKTKAGVYQEDSGCVGTSTAVIDNMKCSLTATRFTLAPYNLNIDDLIQVTVEAYNVMLWSIPSNPNTVGVVAKKQPQKAVTNVDRGEQTAKTQIHITWTGIFDNVDTGGQPVDYKIFYDKGTSTTVQNWYVLTGSTNNATSYIDNTNFKVGILYYFRIIPWNDFGVGLFNSTTFGIWAAIVPSGQAPPTTTLTYNSYTEEDDIIVIDWEQPSDNGGLNVWFSVEVMSKSSGWMLVNQNSECYELTQTTPYHMPLIAAADLGTRCTILISNLKSKYGLLVGDTVQARVTAIQQVGQVTSDGGGTAVLPIVPCFRTTFPRIIGGSDSATKINAMDIDEKGHIVVGGYSRDSGVIGKVTSQNLPFAAYIAKGNYYAWGKYFQTTDYGAGTAMFQQVLDITFRYDGEKVALALEKDSYDMSYMIVILNKDGSLSGAYRENLQARGKVNITGMIYDSSNFVTLALDFSPDGTSVKRQALINRFSVSTTTPGTFPTQFYILGGSNTLNVVSQVFALQRVRNDNAQFYVSALITDSTATLRSILGKANFATGAMPKYYFHTPTGYYNTPQSVAVVTRMFLYENPLISQQVVSGCMMSYDGYRIHFGQFVFTGSSGQTQIVLTPDVTTNNRYFCLGIYQKDIGTAYVLYNNRKDVNPSNYALTYGRISYTGLKMDTIDIVNHDGLNNYGGAKFVHMSRFYYWGQTKKIVSKTGNFNYGEYVGMLNLFDEAESAFSCNPISPTQNFVFPTTGFITLTQVPQVLMDMKTSGLTATTAFANTVIKQMRMINLLETEIQNINLNEPITNNTWCPIVTTGGAPTITAPAISFQLFTYDPAISASQTQSFQFNPILVSRFCPDTVIYNLTYQSDINSPLPIFIKFSPDDNRFIFDVFSTDNVGTYQIMLYSTLGNNMTTNTFYTAQIASPCKDNPVQVVAPATTPIYDLSDLQPMYIDLAWIVTYSNPFCAPIYYKFKLFNATTMADITTTSGIFSIVTTSSPQKLKIWTQAIPNTKLWTDLLIVARLQGDLVATHIQEIDITNDCAPTVIQAQVMPDWIYYTGRDSIELTFVWQETIGKCGPISYSIKEYISTNIASNSSLDATVFTYPNIVGTNNTLKIFTADESKVGVYKIRVYASLGVGGDKQSSTVFQTTIIRDPCSYYTFTIPVIEDMTLWINQTDQIVLIPPFQMSDPSWICNFTYVITTPTNQQIDPIFKKNEVVKQGTGPNVTLDTTDGSKVEISPYTIKLKGWPSRQPIAVSQSLTFRIFIALLDKTDCPTGKYYNEATETCDLCQTPCSSCKGGPTECTWCLDAYSLVDNNGVYSCILKTDNCPPGTIRDAFLQMCRKCSDFCKTCLSNTQCTQCIPNYNLAGGECFPFRDCPPGYRFDGSTCIACSSNCEACQSSSECTYCNEGYYLDTLSNQCTQNCPAGYYGDVQSRVCMVCQPSCATCVGNNYTCTSCKDLGTPGNPIYYYLFQSTCVERCPYLQYYQNFANRSCDPCKAECKICVNAKDDCIVCNEGSVIAGRECLNSCPEKSYITVIGTCFPCDPACQKCTGAMNSMCSQCTLGNYLTETTCEPKCNPPLFPDPDSGTCRNCPYYCNQCSTGNDCQKCKTGYLQVPNDCAGENVLKVSNSFTMSVPIDSQLDEFNPTELSSEIWFKMDNANSLFIEVILGTTPYKLRKKANVAQVQLNFDQVNYCDSYNLKSDQWYHFAYAISEQPSQLFCYINGDRISTGITAISIISADILKFREITFGGTNEPKSSEFKFNGYVREFRWWNTVRSAFQIKNFKDIAFTAPSNKMVAYWRLNEDRKTAIEFKDSVNPLLTFNPAPKLLKEVHEMREIFQKMCPEGTYGRFNETSNMQECYKCSDICKNCNGPLETHCTECNLPYKLIEAEQICVIQDGCPIGYYEDLNKECQPCHEYCISCFNTPYQCPKCKAKYFKQYKGLGCVDACPRGLYGNYLTQSCAANPIVTSIYPDDGTIFSYGSFIDLVATFEVQNAEERKTYSYGWILSKLNSNIDLARDAAKPYFNTDITRVHIDNNIIEPNNYYNITFYVKGDDFYYNGMIGSMYNVIYIGIPPKSGKCEITPTQGIAQVTTFLITSYGWQDIDGIAEYKYLYSFDGGISYIPIEVANNRLPSANYTFATIFKPMNGKIKCTAQSIKGFVAEDTTDFVLMKKTSANAQAELNKLDLKKVTNEVQAVQFGNQLMQMATEVGQLREVHTDQFNTRINPDQCSESLCSFGGQCQYDTFSKKYFCICNQDRAGVNCTFKNQTQLQYIKNLTFDLCMKYVPMSLSGRRTYDYQFLKLVTTNMDLMSNDIFDSLTGIVSQQVSHIKSAHNEVGDNKDAENTLEVLSNMLEYLALDHMRMNKTQAFKKMNQTVADEQRAAMKKNLEDTMSLVEQVKNATIYRLDFLQPELSFQTRMVSYRQFITNSDSIVTMPATQNIKKQLTTYVKISPTNFANTSVPIGKQFITETVEYAVNPFQLNNTDNIASNVFEVNIFNQDKTLRTNNITKIDVKNLLVPIEFSYPIANNQNLTDLIEQYNKLSNFKYKERVKKDEMLKKSNINCVYWLHNESRWSSDGCQLQNIDKTHLKCNCTHLSAFSFTFTTPKLTVDAPVLENTTVKASKQASSILTLSDIIKWPLDKYFANMYELWQHNRPSFLTFIIKPGFAVLILFWAMYLSSLIYYSGRDDLRRFKMTKQQNRDDLAELRDDNVQNIFSVIKDLIVKDFLMENGKFIQRQTRRMKAPQLNKKQIQPPQIKIYEQLTKDEQHQYRKRARRKVFGVPAGLCERAKRYYTITMSHNEKNPNAKMSFFNEQLKNNLWIGLIAKTSKIAPRHVRLLMMYFYASLYITLLTLIFGFQIQEMLTSNALFQVVFISVALVPIVWIVTIPVALIFRMPLHLRKMIAGVRTKKVNKAFQEIDKHMGWRYAIGYFICLTMYFIMTVCVLVFNIFYPQDYVMGWFFNIILLYLFDLIVFTFMLAGLQMVNVIISQKVKCWYNVWAAIEVFRYVKNLRG